MDPMIQPPPPVTHDFMCKPITVGCTLVYPWRRGSQMGLKKMNVQQIDYSGEEPVIVGYSSDGRRVRVKNTETCIVVG